MPIPLGYSRNVIYGTLSAGDIFQVSLWVSEAPTDQGATQTQANALAAALNTLLVTPGGGRMAATGILDTGSTITGVKVYSYTSGSGHAAYVADAGVAAGAGTNTTGNWFPPQCAVVATLKTAAAGRRRVGRIYWPIARATVGPPQLTTTTVQQLSAWTAALITSFNTACSPGKVVVLSQTAGDSANVTQVRIDSKVDTQRRRANKVVAAYSFTSAIT